MTSSESRFRMPHPIRLATGLVVGLVALLVLSFVAAHAAQLQLDVADLGAYSLPAEIEIPEIVDYDHFQGTGGLDGSPSPGGGTWEVVSGNWAYDASSSVLVANNSPNALAVLDKGVSDHFRIEVGMGNLGEHPTANGAGIALFASGSNLRINAVYDRRDNQLRLDKRAANGSTTNLATANVGNHVTATLEVRVVQPVIEVYFQGNLVITHNLSSGDLSTYGSNTSHGITTLQDKNTTFDYFWFETLD